MIQFRKAINGKEISQNENLKKVLNIFEQIIGFNKKQEGKGIKILKVYKSIMNSIKVWYKMNTIFMNSGNSKTSDPHRLLLNLIDKIDS